MERTTSSLLVVLCGACLLLIGLVGVVYAKMAFVDDSTNHLNCYDAEDGIVVGDLCDKTIFRMYQAGTLGISLGIIFMVLGLVLLMLGRIEW